MTKRSSKLHADAREHLSLVVLHSSGLGTSLARRRSRQVFSNLHMQAAYDSPAATDRYRYSQPQELTMTIPAPRPNMPEPPSAPGITPYPPAEPEPNPLPIFPPSEPAPPLQPPLIVTG
jgi:hypothetical protein